MYRRFVLIISVLLLWGLVGQAQTIDETGVPPQAGDWHAFHLYQVYEGVGPRTADDRSTQPPITITLDVDATTGDISISNLHEGQTVPLTYDGDASYSGDLTLEDDSGGFTITTTYRIALTVLGPERIQSTQTLSGYEGGWMRYSILQPTNGDELPQDPRTGTQAIDCDGAVRSMLDVGARARVVDAFFDPVDTNLYAEPTTSSTLLTATADVLVLDGPVCAESRLWWQVYALPFDNSATLDVTPQVGWIGEGTNGSYAFLPETQRGCGALPPRLIAGEMGSVLPAGANNMRHIPAVDGDLLGQIPVGGMFDISAGPTCNDGYNWWRVTYEGITGWTAEGGDDYWLQPE